MFIVYLLLFIIALVLLCKFIKSASIGLSAYIVDVIIFMFIILLIHKKISLQFAVGQKAYLIDVILGIGAVFIYNTIVKFLGGLPIIGKVLNYIVAFTGVYIVLSLGIYLVTSLLSGMLGIITPTFGINIFSDSGVNSLITKIVVGILAIPVWKRRIK